MATTSDSKDLATELAASEQKVRELEMRLQEVTDFMENGSLPLHWVSGEGIILWANQAELDALGYEASEYIGQPIQRFHASQENIADILTRLTRNETLRNHRATLLCKAGGIKHVLINSNVYRRDGEFIHTRCFSRDVTEIVLEDERKKDFVAMVSHELKTPITVIQSYLQVLLTKAGTRNDPFLVNALTRSETQVKKMTSLVNNFLVLAGLGEGRIQLNKTDFDISGLLQELLQDAQFLAPGHTVEFQSSGPVVVHADRDKIGQVLINLLTNAVKYSADHTTITLGHLIENGKVTLFVRDQGIGISATEQEKLFDRFYRVKGQQLNMIGGFGIGLYLVAEILHQHEAPIWVESSEGIGSTFYFRLQPSLQHPSNN